MQYFQDADEHAPFSRAVYPGGAFFSGTETEWKDGIYPYLQSGGRPYNNGQPYANHGDGGVFICPDNTATWSNQSPIYWGIHDTAFDTVAGSGGDETTRFPRSYAINGYAGINESGNTGNGGHFWPCVGDGNCDKNSGAIAQLQTPANTIMVAETRVMFPDISPEYLGNECTASGIPAGGVSTSCIQGHTGGRSVFLFFDGHAKAMNAPQTITQDLWDCYAANGRGAAAQKDDLNRANGVPEWNPGF
jgi:prepilin-type processing-associated H-X9-DG protein